jgi:hypothetical protein
MMPEPAHEPNTPHEHARRLGALGLRVLPIKAGRKYPPMNSWQHAATDDADKIDNWYQGLYRDAGVGLALGPQPNGCYLFAIDVDTHDPAHNGWDALADLEAEHRALPDTWRSLTGAAGGHLIFSAPPGVIVRNQQASGNRIAPGIDVRGDGGQIVVAPTIHPDTQRAYAWEAGFAPWEHTVARAPRWLLDLVAERPAPKPALDRASIDYTTKPERTDSIAADVREWFDWRHELAARGWTLDRDDGADSYWVRPGKDRRQGHSAVLHGNDVLVVFTTEIPDAWRTAGVRTSDGSGYSFSPFGFVAAVDHNGDRSEAARALRAASTASSPTSTPNVQQTGTQGDVEGDPDDYDAALMSMLIDWRDFFDTDHQAEDWLWEPVIPAGRGTVIFAKGGTGKSLVLLAMVVDLVKRGVRVLYLDYEMTPADLDERLADMGVDSAEHLEHLHYAQLPSLPAFDTPEGGRAVTRFAQLVDAQLVVIDTFARAVQGEENDSDTVRDFYRMTGLHLKADGRAFIRIDHSGKDEAKGQRGSSAKNDDVDLVWQLKLADDGYTLVRGKCRMGWVPERVALERHDRPFALSVAGGDSWEPGTKECAELLDELSVDLDAGERKVTAAIVEAGHPKPTRKVLRDAIKYRRRRSESFHFVGDEALTQREKARRPIDGAPLRGSDTAQSTAQVSEEGTKALVDGCAGGSTARSAHPSDAGAAQCAPPKGAHGDSVTPETDDEDLF